jgi:ABC-type Zn uptake system ZnuABC Zn-binding protein ZnuA
MRHGFRGIRLGLALACGIGLSSSAETPRLKIVTSFVPVYCFAANVAGDLAVVENLLPSSVDPHDYQLAPRDLAKLSKADVVIVNGLSLEGWLNKAIASAGGAHFPTVVQLADGLSASELIYDADAPWARHEEFHPAAEKRFANPHIWLNPQLAEHAVTNICRALQNADPPNAAGYARNAAAYIARLQKLDAEIRAATASFTHRDIVTDHNAFPYFARRYGLNLVGLVEEVDEVPPSPRYLTQLEQTMRAKHIQVLFTSPPIPPREAGQIAADLGITVATLNTIEVGPLRPTTYEDEMRQNLKTLGKYLR